MFTVKVVVLSSGGIDSSLIMYMLNNGNHEILPLFIDYGQLALNREWDALNKICEDLHIVPHKIELKGFGTLPSGLTNSSLDVYKDAFLPNRNLMFLTVATSYAFVVGSPVVMIGLLAENVFQDQTEAFINKANEMILYSLPKRVEILAPLIDYKKEDILKKAEEFGVPKSTYYCHSGTEIPCGKCISCIEREKAEKQSNESSQLLVNDDQRDEKLVKYTHESA